MVFNMFLCLFALPLQALLTAQSSTLQEDGFRPHMHVFVGSIAGTTGAAPRIGGDVISVKVTDGRTDEGTEKLIPVYTDTPLRVLKANIAAAFACEEDALCLVRAERKQWTKSAASDVFAAAKDAKTMAELNLSHLAHLLLVSLAPSQPSVPSSLAPTSSEQQAAAPPKADVLPKVESQPKANAQQGASAKQKQNCSASPAATPVQQSPTVASAPPSAASAPEGAPPAADPAPAPEAKTDRVIAPVSAEVLRKLKETVAVNIAYHNGKRLPSAVSTTLDISKSIAECRAVVATALGCDATSTRMKVYRGGDAELLVPETQTAKALRIDDGAMLGLETGSLPDANELFLLVRVAPKKGL